MINPVKKRMADEDKFVSRQYIAQPFKAWNSPNASNAIYIADP